MGFAEPLKKFYYAFEDRYYAVLDKINRHIPIYKVIDPIDKYVPSFMLFILLIFLLIFWFLLLPMIGPYVFQPVTKAHYVSIKLIDAETGDPLVGVPVTLSLIDFNQILKEETSEAGIAVFEVPAEQVDVLLSVSAEGYEEIKEKRIVLVADKLKTIELKKTGIYFAENKIEIFVVKRSVGSPKIEDRIITITFTCKRGTPPAPINKHGSQQPFEVIKPKDCEELSGTAVAQGFKPQTLLLEGKKTVIFKLEEIEPEEQKGKIAITVYEYDNNYASNVIVRLYDAKTASLIKQKITDASGTALFEELEPGYYDIGVISGDGRIATKRNVKVNAGETTSVNIYLEAPQPLKQSKKILFKVVDADTQAPIHNAIAFIYADSYFLAEVHTDKNGIGSYLVSASSADKNFKALITHPNFISKVVDLPLLSHDATQPTVIELIPRDQYNTGFAPVPIITADKYFGQAPLEVTFDASNSFDPDGTIVTYSWNFGDGSTASGITAQHTFDESGTYAVTLTVEDNQGLTSETSAMIQVDLNSYAPVAIIDANTYAGYVPLTVQFDANKSLDPDGTIVTYSWNFGDGSTASGQDVIHTFEHVGNYPVTLTVEDNSGNKGFATAVIQVREKPAVVNLLPIAIAKANHYFGIAPLTVQFNASQSFDPDGEIVSYEWDFNGLGTADGIEVIYTFREAGDYTVALTVTDNNGASSETFLLIQIRESPESLPPHAEIDASPYYGDAPLTVSFSASKSFDFTGAIVTYSWNFGDGSTASGITAQHTFEKPGNYTVMLTVTNSAGLSSSDSVIIQVTDPSQLGQPLAPVAIIDADNYAGYAPFTVQFNASQSFDPDGEIVSYEWSFGDGSAAEGEAVTHTFTQAGTYTVVLTVTDDDGLKAERSTTINILPAPSDEGFAPVPIITADKYFGQAPLEVTFDASNSFDPDGTIVTYSWNFGDGSTASGITAQHTFDESGTYAVTLTVEDNQGLTSETSAMIQVTEQPVPNTGNVLALVLDGAGNPIESASVTLYKEGIPFPIAPLPGQNAYTDSAGRYLFENIEPSTTPYFIRAQKNELFGESEHEQLSAGATITLTVVLEHGYGEIKATVVDSEGNPISNAEVSFFDSITNDLINSCITDLAGSCVSGAIEASRIVYVKAWKDGYMGALSEDVQIIANNQHEVTLTLYPASGEISGIEFSFVELCKDWHCNEKAMKVTSLETEENYYYAKFNLTLLADESTDIMLYLRAGLDSETSLPADNYKIKIMEVRAASPDSIFYATCFNPDNPYDVPSDCIASVNSGAKLANVSWDSLSGINGVVVPVVVKFAVQPGLESSTTLELHYAAKATQAGTTVQTESALKQFEVGAIVCSGNAINWLFSLYKGTNLIAEDISSNDTMGLNVNEEYNIRFVLKNCTDDDYTGATLQVWNENVPDAIEFTEFGPGSGPFDIYSSLPSLAPNDSIEDVVKIRARQVAEFTQVKFRLFKGSYIPENGEVSLNFKVLSGNTMVVEGLPEALSPDIPVVLDGYVKDANTATGIEAAIVNVYKNDDIIGFVTTDTSGHFHFEQATGSAGPEIGDTIKVVIEHPVYNTLTIAIPVRRNPISEFACVTIAPEEPVTLNKGESSAFSISTENCPAELAVRFESLLTLAQAEVVLNPTETKEISFTASGLRVFQGIYPIYIKGKFVNSSSPEYRNIGIFEAIINDPNSCFEMDNYIYDMKGGTASGTIRNKCLYVNRDPEMPLIEIDSGAVELSTEPVPTGITFTWHIKSEASEILSNGEQHSLSIISYETTQTVDFSDGYEFVLAEFNAKDYIEGNAEKGITGLKEADSYEGGYLHDVKFIPESSDDRVLVWIEGNLIKGKYVGEEEVAGEYDFTLTNKYLQNTQYAFVTIQDYTASGGGE